MASLKTVESKAEFRNLNDAVASGVYQMAIEYRNCDLVEELIRLRADSASPDYNGQKTVYVQTKSGEFKTISTLVFDEVNGKTHIVILLNENK